MKFISRIFVLLLLSINMFYAAPPVPPGGGGGGVGPGAPANPIDMYVYVLSAIAIVFILYFSRKIKKQVI